MVNKISNLLHNLDLKPQYLRTNNLKCFELFADLTYNLQN